MTRDTTMKSTRRLDSLAELADRFCIQMSSSAAHFFVVSTTTCDIIEKKGWCSMNQAYLFNQGHDHMSYNLLGAFPTTDPDNQPGYSFAVWAPAAAAVSVVGSFNFWKPNVHQLEKLGDTGIWTCFVVDARQWDRYKYAIQTPDGVEIWKADPYARHMETRPDTASILYDPRDFTWQDDKWRAVRQAGQDSYPLNIYEVHLGSWRRHADRNFMNYRELATELGAYLVDMGYNAVELMPVMEHPLDASWGYQVTGYYSVTSRFGTPADFKFMINHFHQLGLMVILDWVPAHFPKDAHALARFDGTALYEHGDPRRGELREWGTYAFDFGKCEVRSFLISNAWFWLDEFHIDGLRVDAVSSMIYADYGRTDFLPNSRGGRENLDAIGFLQQLNQLIRDKLPDRLMIAEESTAWPKVTGPVEDGGLGFTHKWNMGWMHDTLDYLKCDFVYRTWHREQLSFSMTYAFSERYILPLSHDEVVHGKLSLIDRMPGDLWRKFAGLRALYLYQMCHPGGKLQFMGSEFGQFIEWRFDEQLEWFLLEFDQHRLLRDFVRELNHFYLKTPALWQQDESWDGFRWLVVDDAPKSVFAFNRIAQGGQSVTIVLNLTPDPVPNYRIGVSTAGRYAAVLNSDDMCFGGSGFPLRPNPATSLVSEAIEAQGFSESLVFDLPPLCGLVLARAAIERSNHAEEGDQNGKT